MPMHRQTITLPVLALATLLAGCGKSPAAEKTPEKAPEGHAAQAADKTPAQMPAPAASVSGTVLETTDAGGYTYLKLKTASGETWAAVNQSDVKVGQEVTIAGAMPMDGFESPSLKRKFDRIYFGTLAPSAGMDMSGSHAAAPAAPGGP